MSTAVRPKPRDDAYTVLLSISLLAMIGACVMLYYDLKRFPSLKPPATYGQAAPITAAPRIDDNLPAPPADNTPPPGTPPANANPPDGTNAPAKTDPSKPE